MASDQDSPPPTLSPQPQDRDVAPAVNSAVVKDRGLSYDTATQPSAAQASSSQAGPVSDAYKQVSTPEEWTAFVHKVLEYLKANYKITQHDAQEIRANIMGRSRHDFTDWIPSNWNPMNECSKELKAIMFWMKGSEGVADWKKHKNESQQGVNPPQFPLKGAMLACVGVMSVGELPSHKAAKANLMAMIKEMKIEYMLGPETKAVPKFWVGFDPDVHFNAQPSSRKATSKPMVRRPRRFMTRAQGLQHRRDMAREKRWIDPLKNVPYTTPRGQDEVELGEEYELSDEPDSNPLSRRASGGSGQGTAKVNQRTSRSTAPSPLSPSPYASSSGTTPNLSVIQKDGIARGERRSFVTDDEDDEESDEHVISAHMTRSKTVKAKTSEARGKISGKRSRAMSTELETARFDEDDNVGEDERDPKEAEYGIRVNIEKRRRLLPTSSNEETGHKLGHSKSGPTEVSAMDDHARNSSKEKSKEKSKDAKEVAARVDRGTVQGRESMFSMCGRAAELEDEADTNKTGSGTQLDEINTLVDGIKSDLEAIHFQLGSLRSSQGNVATGAKTDAEEQQLSTVKSKLVVMKIEAQTLKENVMLDIGNADGFDWQAAESKAVRVGDTFTVGLDTRLVRWDPSLWQLTQSGLMSPSDVSNKINDMVSQMDLRTWNIQRKYLHWLARSHKVDCLELFKLVRDWELTMGKRGGDWVPGVPGVDLGRMVYVEALLEMYSEPTP